MNQLLPSANKPRPEGLARYGSEPGSLLSSMAESVIAGGGDWEISAKGLGDAVAESFFCGDSPCLTSESSCRFTSVAASASPDLDRPIRRIECAGGIFPPPEYGRFGNIAGGSQLIRHSSSPAGFLDNLLESGVSQPNGAGNSSQTAGKRLSSQWSFSQQDLLSQISESDQFSSWDDTQSILFSSPPHKCAKDKNGDHIAAYSNLESQLSMPCRYLEMEAVEKCLQVQQDEVHCKFRAKRGCATHPRSIAERERRTRISKRLRKLQELVPNMEKQTNTSDMLDLALQYIKELQSQVKKLNQGRADCTCVIKA